MIGRLQVPYLTLGINAYPRSNATRCRTRIRARKVRPDMSTQNRFPGASHAESLPAI